MTHIDLNTLVLHTTRSFYFGYHSPIQDAKEDIDNMSLKVGPQLSCYNQQSVRNLLKL